MTGAFDKIDEIEERYRIFIILLFAEEIIFFNTSSTVCKNNTMNKFIIHISIKNFPRRL